MDVRIENYVEQLQKKLADFDNYAEEEKIVLDEKEIQQFLAEKNRFLAEKGFADKIYSPYDTVTPEYPKVEFDSEFKTYSYYKLQPAEISDEEYLQIRIMLKRLSKRKRERWDAVQEVYKKYSPASKLMFVFAAIVAVIGLVEGFLVCTMDVVTGIITMVTAFIEMLVYIYLGLLFSDVDKLRLTVVELKKEIQELKKEIRK